MSTLSKSKPWDLSHVLDLVNTLSSPNEEDRQLGHEVKLKKEDENEEFHDSGIGEDVEVRDFARPTTGLGDFAKLWEYMGVPNPPTGKANQVHTGAGSVMPVKDYTSDGATYIKPGRKAARTVTWEDPVSADDLTGGTTTDRSVSPGDVSHLTKTQRKKQRRKEAKAKAAAASPIKSGVVSESEADVVKRRTPAKQASIHSSEYNLRMRDAGGSAFVAYAGAAANARLLPASVAPLKPQGKPTKAANQVRSDQSDGDIAPPKAGPVKRMQPSTPAKQSQKLTPYGQYNATKSMWEHTPQSIHISSRMIPSTVQPPKKEAAISPPGLQSAAQIAVNAVKAAMKSPKTPSKKFDVETQPKNSNIIEPKVIRSGEDRNWALFLRLLNEHPSERKYMVAPMNMTTHNSDPKGIHVFVDASNIFIGFSDQLKRERGMPVFWHTTAANLSFDALALLMERRRPVAKRVLVGSTPSVPAFDTARAVGYEVSLLDKVLKARELTERQIYFRDVDAARGKRVPRTTSTPNGHGNTSSGSETTGSAVPQFLAPKLIEQGVDEILHLKICESIIDAETPSTIVLATGDAAKAEYSEGFMVMAERALKKGWKVELVSWSKNVSQMYLRREFRERWGEAFKLVWLDEYAEELLDM